MEEFEPTLETIDAVEQIINRVLETPNLHNVVRDVFNNCRVVAWSNVNPYRWREAFEEIIRPENRIIKNMSERDFDFFKKMADTEFERQDYRMANDVELNTPTNIYVVLKNADFTEGRGPMLYHAVFRNKEHAVNYIMDQDGIFGSTQNSTPSSRTNAAGTMHEYYNGYTLLTTPVIENYDSSKVAETEILLKEKQEQIKKLTDEMNALYRSIGKM